MTGMEPQSAIQKGGFDMNEYNPLLKVRFEGSAVGPSKIPVSHLLRFLSCLNKALHRTGRVLKGDAGSARRGQPPRDIKQGIELDLVSLAHGSPAVVLGFARRREAPHSPEMDFGLRILEESLGGLKAAQEKKAGEAMPPGYDEGVLDAWRDAGSLFKLGISRIEFTLNHRAKSMRTAFTPEGFERIRERISKRVREPEGNVRKIEGRLLMADFKEHGSRVRVHPSFGEPVICHFNEEQKEEVLENILRYVRVVGAAKEDPASRKIRSIEIHEIEPLEDHQDESGDFSPQGSPASRTFWESPSLEELARSQNARPVKDARSLFGAWPGEDDDGFEAAIEELRRPGPKKYHRS